MTKAPRARLTPDTPLVREYPIVECQNFEDKSTHENISVCKYVKPRKTGNKTEEWKDIWEDIILKEWISNPSKIDLKWMKIQVITQIAE